MFRLPALFLPDPVAAIVEKELRSLVRTPRFRLVFIMGFSFGILVWLPLVIGRQRAPDSTAGQEFPGAGERLCADTAGAGFLLECLRVRSLGGAGLFLSAGEDIDRAGGQEYCGGDVYLPGNVGGDGGLPAAADADDRREDRRRLTW